MNNCEQFLEELLDAASPLTGEAAAHAASCPECAALRKTAEQLSGFRPAVPQGPSAEVNRAVKEQASRLCRRRKLLHSTGRLVPFAAAAAVAVLFIVTPYPRETESGRITQAWDQLEEISFELDQEITSCQYDLALASW